MTKIEVIKTLADNGLFSLADDIISSIEEHKTEENKNVYQHIAYLAGLIADMKNWAIFSARGMLDTATRLYGFTQGLAYAEINIVDNDTYDDIEELYNLVVENCMPIIEGKHESEPDPYYDDPNL